MEDIIVFSKGPRNAIKKKKIKFKLLTTKTARIDTTALNLSKTGSEQHGRRDIS